MIQPYLRFIDLGVCVSDHRVSFLQPFKNALRSPTHVVGLQTLTWHLMRRRCQEGHLNPVRCPNCSFVLAYSYIELQGRERAGGRRSVPVRD